MTRSLLPPPPSPFSTKIGKTKDLTRIEPRFSHFEIPHLVIAKLKYQDVVFTRAFFDTIQRVQKKQDSAIKDHRKQEAPLQPQDAKSSPIAASVIAIAIVEARQGLYRRSLWKSLPP